LIPAAQLQQTIAQFCSQIASLRFLDLDYAPRYGLQLLAMNPLLRLQRVCAPQCRLPHARMNKRPAAIAHCRDAQERVKHRPVFADQLDLNL